METTTLDAATATAPTKTLSQGLTDRAKLSQEDFYKIMIAEMTNQDPLNPSDQKAMLDQMSSLQSLEVSSKLSERLDDLGESIERLVFQQRLAGAGSLIGREVVAVFDDGTPVEVDEDGAVLPQRVAKVLVADGGMRLELEGGHQVALRNVREIRA